MRYILAASLILVASQPLEAQYDRGRWTIVAQREGSIVYVELVWPDGSNWKNAIDISDLEGLQRTELLQSPHTRAFQILQDAGRFDFEGTVGRGRGQGEFHFTPNQEFGPKLQSLGITGLGEVTDWDLTNLAWGGFSARSAREFAALGFAPLSKNEMMDLAVQHVSPHFVLLLRALGVRDLETVHDAVAARMFGVTPQFVRALAMAGISGLSGDELVSLRMSGVTADYVRAAHQSGLRNLNSEGHIEMRQRAKRGSE